MGADSNQEQPGGGYASRRTDTSDDSSSDTDAGKRKRSREEDSTCPPPGLNLLQQVPAVPKEPEDAELDNGFETLHLSDVRKGSATQEPVQERKEAKPEVGTQKPNPASASVLPKEEITEQDTTGGDCKRQKPTMPKHLKNFEHHKLTEVEYNLVDIANLAFLNYGEQSRQYAEAIQRFKHHMQLAPVRDASVTCRNQYQMALQINGTDSEAAKKAGQAWHTSEDRFHNELRRLAGQMPTAIKTFMEEQGFPLPAQPQAIAGNQARAEPEEAPQSRIEPPAPPPLREVVDLRERCINAITLICQKNGSSKSWEMLISLGMRSLEMEYSHKTETKFLSEHVKTYYEDGVPCAKELWNDTTMLDPAYKHLLHDPRPVLTTDQVETVYRECGLKKELYDACTDRIKEALKYIYPDVQVYWCVKYTVWHSDKSKQPCQWHGYWIKGMYDARMKKVCDAAVARGQWWDGTKSNASQWYGRQQRSSSRSRAGGYKHAWEGTSGWENYRSNNRSSSRPVREPSVRRPVREPSVRREEPAVREVRFPATDYRLNQSRREQTPQRRNGWETEERKPLAQLVAETKAKYKKLDLNEEVVRFCQRPGCDRFCYPGKTHCCFMCKDFSPEENPDLWEPHTEHCCMNMQIQLDVAWNGKITTSEDTYPVPVVREKAQRRPRRYGETHGKGFCMKCLWRRGTEKFPLKDPCTICGGPPNHHGGCCKVPSSIEELCERNQYNCEWIGPMGSISLPGGSRNNHRDTEERDRVYQDQFGNRMRNPPILVRPRTLEDKLILMDQRKQQQRPQSTREERQPSDREPRHHPTALSAGPRAEAFGTWRTGFDPEYGQQDRQQDRGQDQDYQQDRQQDRRQDRYQDRRPPVLRSRPRQERTIFLAFAGDGMWPGGNPKDPDRAVYTSRPYGIIKCHELSDPEDECYSKRGHTGKLPALAKYVVRHQDFRHIIKRMVTEVENQFKHEDAAYISFVCSRGKHRSQSMLHIVSLIFEHLNINYQVERNSNRHSRCKHYCGECNGDWHEADKTQVIDLALAFCERYVDWGKLTN